MKKRTGIELVRHAIEESIGYAELGRRLTPPRTRQTVNEWKQVPLHFLHQVASILELHPADVRPDVHALFKKTAA